MHLKKTFHLELEVLHSEEQLLHGPKSEKLVSNPAPYTLGKKTQDIQNCKIKQIKYQQCHRLNTSHIRKQDSNAFNYKHENSKELHGY
jgi:hypothetical protein